MSDAHSLKNKWIVITRPEHQAQELSKKLLKVGGCPIHFPLIEIKPIIDLASVKHQLDSLQDYDLIIFISANAVEQTLDYLPAESLASVKIASVGKKTAQALTNCGVNVDFCPEQIFNSEALLAIPEFQKFIKGKKIAIIRGRRRPRISSSKFTKFRCERRLYRRLQKDSSREKLTNIKGFLDSW